MKRNFLKFLALAAVPAMVLTSCKEDEQVVTPEPADNSIYADLGGSAKVDDPNNPGTQIETGYLTLRSVVDSTIFVIAGDGNLNGYFGPLLAEVGAGNLSGFANLSKDLTDFFAANTGGNFTYSGMNMVDAHRVGTNNRNQFLVNNTAFDNFIGAVVAGAGRNGVPADAPVITRIGALLESLRPAIVQTDADISAQASLYADLGGSAMVPDQANGGAMIEAGYLTLRNVVDSSIFVIAGDNRLNSKFFSVLLNEVGANDLSGFAALSTSLTTFLAFSAGSTNPDHIYNGLNMVDAHNPNLNGRMGAVANDAEFDAFIEDVVIGAGKNGVPSNAPVIAKVGALLNSLRTDVVQN